MLSHADHDRIAAAVAEAEGKSSGEILCVLQHKVSDYREVPLAWAAGCALIIPALLAAFGVEPPASTICVAADSAGNVITSTQPLTTNWKVTHIDPVSGVTCQVVVAPGLAEMYCTDQPLSATAPLPALVSSMKSLVKVAPLLPPPP